MTDANVNLNEEYKKILLEAFTSQYQILGNLVNKLPINPKIKEIAIQRFDEGYLWAKEAFLYLNLTPPAAKEAISDVSQSVETQEVKKNDDITDAA